jgi:hypothetical protein
MRKYHFPVQNTLLRYRLPFQNGTASGHEMFGNRRKSFENIGGQQIETR